MSTNFVNGGSAMTTTGELRAIIEELELVDIGDAASYLGEEGIIGGETLGTEQSVLTFVQTVECVPSSCEHCSV
jgi:hypothetical protein